MDPWPMIEADRQALADYLAGLSPDEWKKQSLCEDWNVEEVAAHLLIVPTVSKPTTFVNFVGAGFSLDKFSDKMIAKLLDGTSTDDIVDTLRSAADNTNVPPGMKPINVLGDLVVHSADISEGVGKPLDYPVDHYVAGLESFKNVQTALGSRKRIAGLELKATDADWSYGEGPPVEGTAKDLVLAMTGRTSALDRLTGDGVATLRTR